MLAIMDRHREGWQQWAECLVIVGVTTTYKLLI